MGFTRFMCGAGRVLGYMLGHSYGGYHDPKQYGRANQISSHLFFLNDANDHNTYASSLICTHFLIHTNYRCEQNPQKKNDTYEDIQFLQKHSGETFQTSSLFRQGMDFCPYIIPPPKKKTWYLKKKTKKTKNTKLCNFELEKQSDA